jgi:hypothetical protein
MHTGPIRELADDLAQNLRGGRMRRILDRVHPFSPVVVTHGTDERRDRTTRVAARTVNQ